VFSFFVARVLQTETTMLRSLERRIYIDLPLSERKEPASGHYLATVGVRGPVGAYLILRAKKVRPRKPRDFQRFNLWCQRVELDVGERFDWWLRWHPRSVAPQPRRSFFVARVLQKARDCQATRGVDVLNNW
jgi:hypothetical protein